VKLGSQGAFRAIAVFVVRFSLRGLAACLSRDEAQSDDLEGRDREAHALPLHRQIRLIRFQQVGNCGGLEREARRQRHPP